MGEGQHQVSSATRGNRHSSPHVTDSGSFSHWLRDTQLEGGTAEIPTQAWPALVPKNCLGGSSRTTCHHPAPGREQRFQIKGPKPVCKPGKPRPSLAAKSL